MRDLLKVNQYTITLNKNSGYGINLRLMDKN